MKEDKLRTAWDDVKMSRAQDERIWRRACEQVRKNRSQQTKRWSIFSIGGVAAACMLMAAVFLPPVVTALVNQQSAMAEYPVELPEAKQGEWKNYVLVHSLERRLDGDVNVFHMVVSVNEMQKEIKLMYLPNGLTLVSCNNGTICTSRLSFMGYLGGTETLTEYLGAQLNIPIEGTIAVNEQVRKKLINMAGGVYVSTEETEQDFSKLQEKIYRWNEQGKSDGGVQKLDGSDAVEWCDDGLDDGDEIYTPVRSIEVMYKTLEGLSESELTEEEMRNWSLDMCDKGRIETDMEPEAVSNLIWDVIEGGYQISDVCNLRDSGALRENDEFPVSDAAGSYIGDWTAWLEYISEYLYGEPTGNEAEAADVLRETFIEYLGVSERGGKTEVYEDVLDEYIQ